MATIAGSARRRCGTWARNGFIHSGRDCRNDSVALSAGARTYEAKVVVVRPAYLARRAIRSRLGRRAPQWRTGRRLDVGPERQTVDQPLKSWEDLGHILRRAAIYHKQLPPPTAPAGKKWYLEIADARDYGPG